MIRVLGIFWRILFSSKHAFKIARTSLIYESNFDLPESAQSDVLIFPRIFLRTLKVIVGSKKLVSMNLIHAEVAGLGESMVVWDSHRHFNCVNRLPDTTLRISYGNLLEQLTWNEFIRLNIIIGFISPIVILQSIFSDRKASYANCILYACQVYIIRNRLILAGTKLLIDYSAYSNQSNWLSMVLMDCNVEILKVPSIVPLAGHFKHVISSKLWLSTPYHLDEVESFRKGHLVREYVCGMPKNASYVSKYMQRPIEVRPKVIGYYSHASWVRADQDHGASEFGLPEMEEKVIRLLGEYCLKNKGLKLHIYTHPKERKLTLESKTKAFYQDKLPTNIDVDIYMADERSATSFEAAEVGVGTMSSILFERLLCGFKTLFYTEGMTSFPVDNSKIETICAAEKEALFQKLDDQLSKALFPINEVYRFDSEFYSYPQ